MKTEIIQIRITKELKEKIVKAAEAESLTISAWLSRIATLKIKEEDANNENLLYFPTGIEFKLSQYD